MKIKKIKKGFTLIELLIVIAIIGILSSIVLVSLNIARGKAKIAGTKSQLAQIRSGIVVLESDLGKTVKGCPIDVDVGLEVSLADPETGLITAPTDFTDHSGCQWTAEDVANWKGPYIKTPIDPWGNEYWYDEDYHPLRDADASCTDTYPGDPTYPVISSGGPNGVNGAEGSNGPYDCDDIFLIIGDQN